MADYCLIPSLYVIFVLSVFHIRIRSSHALDLKKYFGASGLTRIFMNGSRSKMKNKSGISGYDGEIFWIVI
jgi:hypothetical protein